MRILFINNDGGGFADHIEVAEGTTAVVLRVEAAQDGHLGMGAMPDLGIGGFGRLPGSLQERFNAGLRTGRWLGRLNRRNGMNVAPLWNRRLARAITVANQWRSD